jgi:hypothetical protein
VVVPEGSDGSVLDVGRRSRTVPPALRRALEARDRGCRFPGCGLRFTDAHHVTHWADGGETSLKNTVLLCRRHHRLVHEDGFQLALDREGSVAFFTPRGKPIAASAPMTRVIESTPAAVPACDVADRPRSDVDRRRAHDDEARANEQRPFADGRPGSATALLARNRARGVEPDWRTGRPTHRFERDIPIQIEKAALEAMDQVVARTDRGTVGRSTTSHDGCAEPSRASLKSLVDIRRGTP